MAERLLVVDDDRAFRVAMGALLGDEGFEVRTADSADAALAVLRGEPIDLVLLDLRMPGRDGLSLLEEIRRAWDVPILMLTGYATVESAVQALKLGADDYLTKPCDFEELRAKIRTLLARRDPSPGPGFQRLVTRSPRMRAVLRAAARVAPTDATVLLRGATGTGKELLARAIHEESPRRNGPFVAINCSALAEGVLESELFGHVRGAFTGAVSDRRGLFEEAHGGTLFLDEIGDVGPALQSKLLRVLQEREVVRVGSSRPIRVDVRVLAATNQDLEALVADKQFRADLYYRLRVFQLWLPELRERKEDIPLLAQVALARWNARGPAAPRRIRAISDEALAVLQAYDWPGNVRELMAAIEYACIVCDGDRILPCHLPPEIRDGPPSAERAESGERAPAPERAEGRRYQAPSPEEEREAIRRALEEAQGNRTRAAAALGMGRTTLWQKLKAYGLDRELPRQRS